MNLGILGFQASGKTTVYNSLTASDLETGQLSGGRPEIQTGLVDVPDHRLDALFEAFRPARKVHVKVGYADISGLAISDDGDSLPGELINHLQQMDAFLHVVRAFEDPNIPARDGQVDPQRDAAAMEAEFLLHDMVAVERQLERLVEMRGKGGGDRALMDRQIALFERLQASLAEGSPLRSLTFSDDEIELLAGYVLLSLKPLLLVVNLGENQEEIRLDLAGPAIEQLTLKGRLEMEISQLDEETASAFQAEFDLEELGREKIVQASFELLDWITFFTMNEDEVRGWALARGATALDAAGTIHTDLARGFIRAEVINWGELIRLGGLSDARAQGQLNIAGKDYTVEDGDVVQVRFNV